MTQYIDVEGLYRASLNAQSAADNMCRAAGTAEEAARSLRCLFEEGYGSPALELLELLRNQQGNLAHENQQLRAELDALGKLLPGTMYMDQPDGGSPTIGEQVTRMIADLQNQNAELVAQVERLINFSNERIARASILRICIEKVLSCEELVFNSEVVLIVNSVLADEIRCSLEDKTPAQCLRDVKAEAGRAGFVAGFIYALGDADEHDIEAAEFNGKQYAASVKAGEL